MWCAGIIPAYAGNTLEAIMKAYDTEDHPRVCGEHGRQIVRRIGIRGSSPRMRGTLPQPNRHTETRGIIPAYAGNTVILL